MNHFTIGITDCGRYDNYANWIKTVPGARIVKLTYQDNNPVTLSQCNGIVLSGGQDVHPRYYDKMEYMDFYTGTTPDIDEERDAFEWKVLEYAQENRLPVLGICRGLQLANAFFGGTLELDIPARGERNHSKIREGEDRYHTIRIMTGSLLEKIVTANSGTVNSAHHQSALTVAENLWVTAISEDDVIEALERKETAYHPYLMLVQWHPERMTDQESAFSLGLKNSFIHAVEKASLHDTAR